MNRISQIFVVCVLVSSICLHGAQVAGPATFDQFFTAYGTYIDLTNQAAPDQREMRQAQQKLVTVYNRLPYAAQQEADILLGGESFSIDAVAHDAQIKLQKAPKPAAPKVAQQAAPPAAVPVRRADYERKEAAAKITSNTLMLMPRYGEGVGVIDCSFEALKNGQVIQQYIQKFRGAFNKEQAQARLVDAVVPDAWYETAHCMVGGEMVRVEPTEEEMQEVIKNHRVFKPEEYIFFTTPLETNLKGNALLKELSAFVPGIAQAKAKINQGFPFAFITNMGAHWFAIVVHRVKDSINYYVIDDLWAQLDGKFSDDNKAAVNLLKNLLEHE